jgi:uncharacterized protein YjiS (DUF1127 family)
MLEHDTADTVGRAEPERWESRKRLIVRRAYEARSRAMRDFFDVLSRPMSSLAALVRRSARAYATWRLRRQAIGELGSLDDRMLKDFGISRSEIEAVVYGRDQEPTVDGKVTAFAGRRPSRTPEHRRAA